LQTEFSRKKPHEIFYLLPQLERIGVRHHSEIRVERCHERPLGDSSGSVSLYLHCELREHPVARFGSDKSVLWKDDISEKVDTVVEFSDGDFFRVQLQRKPVVQETRDRLDQVFQICAIGCDDGKVVRIAGILFYLEIVFDKLVKLVHVGIREKLRGEIADRQSFAIKEGRLRRRETPNDLRDEAYRGIILDALSQNAEQDVMIDAIEELPDVAFQNEARGGAVPGYRMRFIFENLHALVSAETDTTREGGPNKGFLEHWVDHRYDCVMQHPIPHGCFVDVPLLGVVDVETVIWPVSVRSAHEIPMQLKNVLLKMILKPLHVILVSFVSLERVPRGKEIFERRNTVECVFINLHKS